MGASRSLVLLVVPLLCACPRQAPPPAGDRDLARPPAVRAVTPRAPPAKLPALDRDTASRLVKLSLHCVGREYPNKLAVVLSGDGDVAPPRQVHPAFFGCFDWHSAVHGHWAMVRVLRRFGDLPEAQDIRAALDRSLAPERIAGEIKTFEANKLLERPYGWAWLLRLCQEIGAMKDDAAAERWLAALRPLEQLLVSRTGQYLERLSVPVRAGTHHSTAFALAHILDYAVAAGDEALAQKVRAAARRFYLQDRACPLSYEPSGEDFVSPCLAEADLMRRVLQPADFNRWFEAFLPGGPGAVTPLEVRDLKDPKIGHLIGLDFQRAWSLRGVAAALGPDHRWAASMEHAAAAHGRHGLKLMHESGYGGAHWLASFAIYLLSGVGLAR